MVETTKLLCTTGLITGPVHVSKTDNRDKLVEHLDKVMHNPKSWTDDKYVINLGKPEEAFDSNMVDEGAMTSVQYYNDLREKASKKPV